MFIQENCYEFSIQMMCDTLEVSRAGYYAWKTRPDSTRNREDKHLKALIKTSFTDSRCTYGYRRIQRDLHAENKVCGKHRIIRLMRELDICPKTKRKFKVTTDSKHSKPISDNILQRQFNAAAPNQRWASDITYIPTVEGWLYLGVIMDLYSRRIVGWSMSNRM